MSALECIDSITVGYCDWLKKKELLFHSTVLIDTNEMIKWLNKQITWLSDNKYM